MTAVWARTLPTLPVVRKTGDSSDMATTRPTQDEDRAEADDREGDAEEAVRAHGPVVDRAVARSPASEPFWLGPVVAVGAMACGVAEPSGCATSVIDCPPARSPLGPDRCGPGVPHTGNIG